MYKIKEIGRTITGNTPSSSNPEHFGYDVMFVTPTDNFDNKYIKHTKRYLSLAGVEKLKSKLLPPDSLLITCIGSDMGKVSINKSECITNQQINSIILDDKFHPDYIYYCLKNDYLKLRNSVLGSTAIPILNKSNFENLELELLSDKNEQIKVSTILVNLDLKIELNNSINTELETMAKTIYDYWFVQFDFPDENGKPYKSSGGEMVWNEELKKEIPKDWKVVKLNSFVKINSGYPFKSSTYVPNGKYKIITIKNVQDKSLDSDKTDKIDVIPKNMSSICKLDIGDFLISLTGNVGRTCLVDEENLLLNQRVGKINTEETDRYFIYCLFNSSEYKNYLTKIAGGSSQANLSPIEAVNFNIPKPENKTLTYFNSIIKPLIDRIILNNIENKKLIELRNFLLPLLMNGQVTIND